MKQGANSNDSYLSASFSPVFANASASTTRIRMVRRRWPSCLEGGLALMGSRTCWGLSLLVGCWGPKRKKRETSRGTDSGRVCLPFPILGPEVPLRETLRLSTYTQRRVADALRLNFFFFNSRKSLTAFTPTTAAAQTLSKSQFRKP